MASAPTPSLARTHLQIQSWPAPASPAPPETWTLSAVSTELGAALRGEKTLKHTKPCTPMPLNALTHYHLGTLWP